MGHCLLLLLRLLGLMESRIANYIRQLLLIDNLLLLFSHVGLVSSFVQILMQLHSVVFMFNHLFHFSLAICRFPLYIIPTTL